MATKVATNYLLSADDAKQIQWMLLDAIRAKTELDLLRQNIEQAANAGYDAKVLLSFKPAPVDLDVTEAAGMVQVLNVLPAGKEA